MLPQALQMQTGLIMLLTKEKTGIKITKLL